jgi:hypothetical protein
MKKLSSQRRSELEDKLVKLINKQSNLGMSTTGNSNILSEPGGAIESTHPDINGNERFVHIITKNDVANLSDEMLLHRLDIQQILSDVNSGKIRKTVVKAQ